MILSSIIVTEYLSGLAHNSAQLIWMGLIFEHALEKVYIKLCVKFKLSRFATFLNNSEKHSEFLLCFRDMNFRPISLIFEFSLEKMNSKVCAKFQPSRTYGLAIIQCQSFE